MTRFVMTMIFLLSGNAATNAAITTLTPETIGVYIALGGAPSHFPGDFGVASFNGPANNGFEFRSYLVFNMSSIPGTVLSVDLQANSGLGVEREVDVDIAFRSFPGSVGDLTNGTANFADLINGDNYATYIALATFPDNTNFEVSLSATAIADINSGGEFFAITVTQPVATPKSGFLFDLPVNQFSLVVTSAIPEPSTLAALSVGGLCALTRRRQSAEKR